MLTVLHKSLWSLCYDWSATENEMGLPLLSASVFMHLDPVPGFLWPLSPWVAAQVDGSTCTYTLFIFSHVYHEADVQNGSDEPCPLSMQGHQSDKLSLKDFHCRHPKSWCLVAPLSPTSMGSVLLTWSSHTWKGGLLFLPGGDVHDPPEKDL